MCTFESTVMKSFDNISFICENLLVLNMKREILALLYENQDDGGQSRLPGSPTAQWWLSPDALISALLG